MRAGNTSITSSEHGQQTIGNRRLALTVLSVAVVLGASATPLRAEVNVHGNSAAVHLEANNAPLSEVLSALESAFSVRHRTSVPLDQAISGTYRGPLRRVLSRVLEGFNYYVANTVDGRIEIIVIGRSGARSDTGGRHLDPVTTAGTGQRSAIQAVAPSIGLETMPVNTRDGGMNRTWRRLRALRTWD